MKKKFTVRNRVWIWPSRQTPWHFIYVDGKVKDEIQKIANTHGFGFVKIHATLGETTWETSLFPHKKENCYLLAIKKAVRQKETVFDGDMVEVRIELI